MEPAARSMFGAPMFEPQVFRKHMCSIKESTGDMFGTFWRPLHLFAAPRNDLAPEELWSRSPSLRLCMLYDVSAGMIQECTKM